MSKTCDTHDLTIVYGICCFDPKKTDNDEKRCSECNAWTERSLLDRLGLCPTCRRSYYA